MTRAHKPRLSWRAVRTVLGAVLVLALVEASVVHLASRGTAEEISFLPTFRNFLVPWGILGFLSPLVLFLARRIPLTAASIAPPSFAHFFCGVVIGVLHYFLLVHAWNFIAGDPRPIGAQTRGLLQRYLLQDLFLYFTVVTGLQMVWRQRELAEREIVAARLAAELTQAKLLALQARLEPHFLFNALNSAVMLVRDDRKDKAIDVLLQLSDLLRTVLGNSGHAPLVPLREELGFVERYLAVEKARFEDQLTVTLNVDRDLEEIKVPFLVLQPLVENALKHGVARRCEGIVGRLEVTVRREGPLVALEVRDNGPGPRDDAPSSRAPSGTGLRNLRARLHALWGERATVSLAGAEGGGTVARVTLMDLA